MSSAPTMQGRRKLGGQLRTEMSPPPHPAPVEGAGEESVSPFLSPPRGGGMGWGEEEPDAPYWPICTQVVLISVYLSMACSDLSRPKPDCLKPPKGELIWPLSKQ